MIERRKNMIDNPTLTLESDYLGAILQRVLDYDKLTPAQQKKYYEDKTTQQNGEFLIGVFLWDVIQNGYAADVELDMRYDTLHMLPVALRRCLQTYCSEPMPLKQAADGTARSFAAYLFALGMNEHDAKLKVLQKGTAFVRPRPDEGPLWGPYLRITTGLRREKDFLIPALEGGSGVYRDGMGLMLLAVGPAIRAYKAAFGVDLSQYGLVDMALEVDTEK